VRLVVLFPGALGDLCLLAPALTAVMATGTHVDLSVRRCLQPVATMLLPTAGIGPPMDGALAASLFTDEPGPELIEWLRAADAVHAWLARTDSDGRLHARLGDLVGTVRLHAVPRHDDTRHVGEDYAAALGWPGPLAAPHATLAVLPARSPWRGPEATRVVLHPGSGGQAKRWEARGFREVAEAVGRSGGEAIVLLGPAEADEASAWRAGGQAVADGLDVVTAASLIATAPNWVGNDSGMSHLAAALGRGGVVLFGPTRPARWRPRGGGLVPVEFTGRSRASVLRDVLATLAVSSAGA
jgi:hypothetical protein